MLEYARWKYILIVVVLLLGLLLALPNVFGDDPALQVARSDHAAVTADSVTEVESFLKAQKIDIQQLMQTMSLDEVKSHLNTIIKECAAQTLAKAQPIELQRGFATIPLRGIDVPFHSTFLRSGVKPFRSFLMKKINKTSIDPSKLVGKYIPNVTARPFELTREYFEDVYRLTNSPRIGNILANWEKYESSGEIRGAAPAA